MKIKHEIYVFGKKFLLIKKLKSNKLYGLRVTEPNPIKN